ncbi:hypothetical protein BIY24_12535 [Halobacteriovorax marinus]|uniref:hypothetical protein n=1 Tax=Halobacteriovorax marinus TaxID=97084 RepID=UPI000BC35CD0|nr:hypothetical protein [Halobacteriovorax marinus]ATH08744.1 hypothetical protein BIY24_12535 [Halobacteriovorax marinus]
MKWNNLKFIALIIASLMLTACVEQKSNKKSSSDTSTTQSTILLPDESGGDGDDDGYVDETDLPSYYDLPPVSGGPEGVIVHGTNHPNRNPPPNGIFWSSARNMSAANQEILKTDSRFNIRLMALNAPNQNSTDSNGVKCSQLPVGYQKLQVSLCVRKKNGACVYMHNFTNLYVNEWSLVKEFNIPANTDEALVIDVIDVQWDFSCTWNGGNNNSYCPFSAVWDNDCVRFKMQVSTDGTQDLPGGRY